MNIPLRVKNIKRKYQTSDPFELASLMNIEIMYQPLGPLRGYFVRALRRKFIVINTEFPRHIQKQTCAHELAHSVLHKGLGYFYVIKCTFYSADKFERQANEFAWNLLFDKKECIEDFNGDLHHYSKTNGIFELIEFYK